MRIAMIGSGNVATVLARRLHSAGHRISQVHSRDLAHAESLAALVEATAIASLRDMTAADLYLIAVSDDALPVIASSFTVQSGIVAHTAGAAGRDLLAPASTQYGVFYPLQSLRRETANEGGIPVLVDGNTMEVRTALRDLAASISEQVSEAGDEERRKLHLAAVIAGNFSNHLYALAQGYCLTEGLDFRLLIPLLKEVVMRLEHHSAAALQTGPAIREDRSTIASHREALKQHPGILRIYDECTESIIALKHRSSAEG